MNNNRLYDHTPMMMNIYRDMYLAGRLNATYLHQFFDFSMYSPSISALIELPSEEQDNDDDSKSHYPWKVLPQEGLMIQILGFYCKLSRILRKHIRHFSHTYKKAKFEWAIERKVPKRLDEKIVRSPIGLTIKPLPLTKDILNISCHYRMYFCNISIEPFDVALRPRIQV